jgi:hypothetical protein
MAAVPEEHTPCALMPCPTRAYLRIQRRGTRLNVCRKCAETVWQQQADEWCETYGLRTLTQMRAYARPSLFHVAGRIPEGQREREPGADEGLEFESIAEAQA